MTRLVVLVLGLAIAVGCNSPGSEASNITFNGERYVGGVASDFRITPSDLSPVGEASEVRAAVDGTTVFALSGVDARQTVVMEPPRAGSDYYIFFHEDLGGDGTPMSGVIDGLCRYLESPGPECTASHSPDIVEMDLSE